MGPRSLAALIFEIWAAKASPLKQMLKIWEEVVGSMMLWEPGKEKNHWQE